MVRFREESEKRLSIVRKIANRVFERENLSVPVNIEELIKKYAKIECDEFPLGDAICVGLEKDPLIIYNEDRLKTRLRFTLAHELGHIKIPWHTGMISCHTEDEISEGEYEYQEIERQANTFASELLMPTSWLEKIISENESKGLSVIINEVCEKANVSFLASLYAVTNLLPEGYYVSIEKVSEGYIQKKSYKDSKIVNLYDRGEFSLIWLGINSIDSGIINRQSEIIRWVNLGKTIERKYIEDLFSKYELSNTTGLLSIIFDKHKLSPANSLEIIRECLPEGYIIKAELNSGNFYRYLKSNNTFITPRLESNNDDSLVRWYNQYSTNRGIYTAKDFKIYWWTFDTFNEVVDDISDKRDSKAILRQIINDTYFDEERKIMFSRINGVIGSINNRINRMTESEFYNALKHKFIGREDLEGIIDHEDYDKFLLKKTIELYKKVKVIEKSV